MSCILIGIGGKLSHISISPGPSKDTPAQDAYICKQYLCIGVQKFTLLLLGLVVIVFYLTETDGLRQF